MLTLERLRREDGAALLLALGVVVVLAIVAFSAANYSVSTTHSTAYSNADQRAFAMAEAGIGNAVSVIFNPGNNALNQYLFCAPGQALPCQRTIALDGGTVTYSAMLDQSQSPAVWRITSTGTLHNPTGAAADVHRAQTADVRVIPKLTGTVANPVWNYIYVYGTGDPSGCDFSQSNNSTMSTSLYVTGNACFSNQAWVTGELQVHGTVTLNGPQNKVGVSASQPDTSGVHIAGGCRASGGSLHIPCTAADRVYASPADDASPITLATPTPAWNSWYLNASPGPYFSCYMQSGAPPTFDNDQGSPTAPDVSKLNRSVAGTFNLTPPGAYSCRTAGGEISWDPAANPKLLTVNGTVFIDGNARIELGGSSVVRYAGQGSLWLSGSFVVKNTSVCAVVSGSSCDWGYGSGHWDPNTTFLEVIAGLRGGGGQSDVPASDISVELQQAGFQGGIQSAQRMDVGSSSSTMGPIITRQLTTGQSLTTYRFPPLTTVPVSTPDNQLTLATPQPPENFSG